MASLTDWDEWHGPYDDPDSSLSRRLRIIQRHIHDWLDETAPAAVTALSICAGDGRDLIESLSARDDAVRVTATLLELDPRNARRARASCRRAGLQQVAVRQCDAGDAAEYANQQRADVVLLAGVFGNISDADVQRTIAVLPGLCARGALVIWTRHHKPPDLTGDIRRWFADVGFRELAFTAPADVVFSVGAHVFTGSPAEFRPEGRLFDFVR